MNARGQAREEGHDFEALTPAELRKEADRRELVAKARAIAEAREARNVVAEAVLAIPATVVQAAGARNALRTLLATLVKMEDEGPKVTNGDVNVAGFGAPDDWWQKATADHPKYQPDSVLDRVKHQRRLPW